MNLNKFIGDFIYCEDFADKDTFKSTAIIPLHDFVSIDVMLHKKKRPESSLSLSYVSIEMIEKIFHKTMKIVKEKEMESTISSETVMFKHGDNNFEYYLTMRKINKGVLMLDVLHSDIRQKTLSDSILEFIRTGAQNGKSQTELTMRMKNIKQAERRAEIIQSLINAGSIKKILTKHDTGRTLATYIATEFVLDKAQ